MAKAVIFDFDGVIARTEPLHLRSFQDALRPLGIRISPERWPGFTGLYGKEIMKILFRENGITEDVEAWTEKRRRLFMRYAMERPLGTVRGLRKFLKKLHELKIYAAIASGSRRSMILPILSRLRIRDEFCAVVGAEDVANRKPHPEPFLKAAGFLGVSPSECIAIEDSPNGVESAIAANMRTFCIRSPASKALKYDVQIINDYNEFPISVLQGI